MRRWCAVFLLLFASWSVGKIKSSTVGSEVEGILSGVGLTSALAKIIVEELHAQGLQNVCDLGFLRDEDYANLGLGLVQIRKLQSYLQARCDSGNAGMPSCEVAQGAVFSSSKSATKADGAPPLPSGEEATGVTKKSRMEKLQQQPGPRPRRFLSAGVPPAGLSDTERRQLLHERLLEGYDMGIPPLPVTVQISINFFKIVDLDLKSSQLSLAVWFRATWADARLAWNATQWGINYTTIQAESHNLENSLVWTPDLELVNNAESMSSSLATKPLVAYPDGTMLWSRPGTLKTLCKFEGLLRFPYDTLSCKMEFSAWSLDGFLQDIIPRESDGGYSWAGTDFSGETAGSTFQDYEFTKFEIERKELMYPPYPEPWPIIIYTVFMKRSSSFYEWKLIIPQICMAILSFIPYFMSPECGERLGFGITLVLAILTTDVLSMDMQPVCEEELLMDRVTRMSFFFCMISLLESGLVIFIFFLECDNWWDLVPHRIQRIMYVVFKCRGSRKVSPPHKSSYYEESPESGCPQQQESGAQAGTLIGKEQTDKSKGGSKGPETFSKLSYRVRKQLLRQAFYQLDEDFSGRLDTDEISKFGQFMLGPEWSEVRTRHFMNSADLDRSGSLSFEEFCEFCERMVLDDHSTKELPYVREMITGFLNTMKYESDRAKDRWHHIAHCIDCFFRWTVPPILVICLIAILA